MEWRRIETDEMEQSQIGKKINGQNGIEPDRKNRYSRNGIEIKARLNGIVLDRIEQREMGWNRTGWNLIELDRMESSLIY